MDAVPTTRPAPSIAMGAASGTITVLLFTLLHALLISDIWFNVVPMMVAGAVCGASLVWSYRAAVADHAPRRWLAYVGACSGLLITLGIVSLVVLEPRFTMTDLVDNDEALGLLLPPALPLMGAATVVGTGLLWLWLGRRPRALVPLLVSQLLLVFFVGHNLAILGLIEMSSDLLVGLAEFVGLTLLLGGLFAAGVIAVETIRHGPAGRTRTVADP